MTLAELQVKVKNALKNNVGFTEQVKITLEVVWEQITALKTLDGYYTKEINEFIKLNQKNAELTDTAQELLESVKTQYETINELIAKVESVRNEAENVINKRIDELLVPIVYKSGYPIKANQPVIYAGAIYLAKEAFTTSTWESDKSKLIAQTGSGSTSTSNLYAAGKEIKKGELITYENKLYISQSDFVATTWETDSSKFVEIANNEDAYKADIAFNEGDLYTYEGVLYIALSAFISTTWAEDESKFARYNANSSKAKNYAENLAIEKGDSVFYNSKIYIAKEAFVASEWATDEGKFIALENGSNTYTAGKEVGLGDTITYENKVYIAKEAFTATDWATDSSKLVEITSDTNGVDLTAYYTKDEIDAFMAQKMDLLTAGEGVAIDKSDGNITVGVKNYAQIMANLSGGAKGELVVGEGYKKYTAIINLTQAGTKPAGCVRLADDAVDKTLDELRAFIGHYPCLFVDGKEGEPLDPNDYSKYKNKDEYAPITTLGNDVMVKFPRRGLCIRTIGDEVHITFTDDPNSKDFGYYAHTRGSVAKDAFYYGAYKAYCSGSKMYSSSGKTPTVNVTIANFRNQAQARGSGYDQVAFYPRQYLQAAYVLLHQSLNSQEKIGTGKTSGSAVINTGGSDTWGMDSEICKAQYPTYLTDNAHNVKCLGIEDLWGNCWEWIEGCVTQNYNVMTATSGFNDTGKGYVSRGIASYNAWSGAYISSIAGNTELGFYPTNAQGSEATYFCDGHWQGASCVAHSGGSWDYGAECGVFVLAVSDAASNTYSNAGARLMFL